MSAWLHVRRGILLALTWAVLWAPLGVLTGIIMDPNDTMDEPWPALGAYPGFLCAVVLAVLLAIMDRHRRLAEWSPLRAGALGALAGVLMMAPIFSGLLGTPNTEHPLFQGRFVILGAVILLSTVSAVGSVLVARTTSRRASSAT
jgi:peptidoglycan/LPS O-acetylase OafA/YrhL